MKRWWTEPRPVRRLVVAALLAVSAVVLVSELDAVPSLAFQAELRGGRASASSAAAPDARLAILHFRYRGLTRFIRVPVNANELAAARRLDTSCVFSTVGPFREANIAALVSRQAGSATVEALTSELRRIRRSLSLDDDEYLELIARFVQHIPYGTPDQEVLLPVEVVARGEGVCDDKSVLLGALLVHEGYDTAIWAFDAQAHAAVGVRCSGSGTFQSGYALIETTRVSFVGDATGSLGTRAAWRRRPDLIRLGGTRVYRADLESAYLVDALQRARFTARSLDPYVRALSTGPRQWHAVYAEAARRRSESVSLAKRIATSVDDRHRMYATLTADGGL